MNENKSALISWCYLIVCLFACLDVGCSSFVWMISAPARVTPMQSCGWGHRTPQWCYIVSAVHSNGAETPGSAVHSLNHVEIPWGGQGDSEKTIVYILHLFLSPTFLNIYIYDSTLWHKLQAAHRLNVWMSNTSGLQMWLFITVTQSFFHTSQTQSGLTVMSTYTKAHTTSNNRLKGHAIRHAVTDCGEAIKRTVNLKEPTPSGSIQVKASIKKKWFSIKRTTKTNSRLFHSVYTLYCYAQLKWEAQCCTIIHNSNVVNTSPQSFSISLFQRLHVGAVSMRSRLLIYATDTLLQLIG